LASVVTVSLVCLAVAGAVQWIDPVRAGAPDQPLRLATVLYPMWGELSLPVITWITAGLCLSTYLLVMGGTARLMAAQADEGALPKFLGIRTRQGVPIGGIGVLTAIHVTVFFLSHAGWVRIDQLVAIANAFFLSNALLGILAAFTLFRGFGTRLTALLLTAAFLILLSFTPLWVLAVIGGMIGYRFLNKKTVCLDADR
jgi:APA family basic amino acid/polyamine antiporter